jgi:ribosome-associated toxin RatA of RatAB toxin-antitoxin module
MVTINESIEANAPLDRLWEIVSDVDKDPEYWNGMSSIQSSKREGRVIERDVKVGFMGHDGHQTIKLNPKTTIELQMTKGPLKGSRIMKLTPLGESRTQIEVNWDFQFSGVPIFARGFVKSQLERVTKEALQNIKRSAEQDKKVTIVEGQVE